VISSSWANLARSTRGTDFNKELGINLAKLFPLPRNIIFVVDSFYWANWLTGTAIHALIWLDVKHAIAFVNAIHGTFFDAGFIFYIDAWVCDHIGHLRPP
jgi:hypothetical protein